MRRWSIFLGGALLILSNTAPVAATTLPAGPYNVRLSPVGGPPGSEVVVTGNCGPGGTPTTVTAVLDAFNGSRSTARSTTQNSSFTLRLPVPPVAADPTDLEVRVECQGVTVAAPFTVTNRTTTSEPTLFTTIQPAGCAAPSGCAPRVKGFAPDGALGNVNLAEGGGSVAVGSVNGLGRVVATGTASGNLARVIARRVADPNAASAVAPFGDFSGGVSVAFGDVNGDRSDELIVGAGPGGGPHVKVFRYNPSNFWEELYGFYAYHPTMGAGVNVAAADLDRDGRDDIVTGTGPGGGPHVRVFDETGVPTGVEFFAYDTRFRGGVNVAAGDVGEGFAPEIVTGTGPGGGPHVRTFRSTGEPIGGGFYAYAPAFDGGVSVGVGEVSRFGRNAIVTAPFVGGAPHVRVFTSVDGAADGVGFYAFSIAPARTGVAALAR